MHFYVDVCLVALKGYHLVPALLSMRKRGELMGTPIGNPKGKKVKALNAVCVERSLDVC